MIEFLVHECRSRGGATTVTGVVNAGCVKLGTVFDCVSPETLTQPGNDSKTPVRLEVESIVAYGHEIDELPEGMTGELGVEGEGTAQLHHGLFLSERP